MRHISPEELPLPVLETGFSLGRMVLAARKAQGYSQESLGNAAAVSRSTIVQIERGSPRVQFVYWLAVLHALGLLDSLTRQIPVILAQLSEGAVLRRGKPQ